MAATPASHFVQVGVTTPFGGPVVPRTNIPPQQVYYSPTTDYRATIQESHDMTAWVEVTRYAQAQAVARTLWVHDGTVTYSADDATAGSVTFTATDIDGTLTPTAAQDDLDPFLAELRPYRGIIYPDGTQEVVPLGVFRVTELKIGESDGVVTYDLTGFDVSDRLKQPLESPYVIAAGTSFENAIGGLLSSRLPSLDFRLKVTGYTTPSLIIDSGKNPWQEAAKLALSCGDWLYVARDGAVASEPVRAVPKATPSWQYVEGSRSVFWGANRATKADDFPNVVKITGGNNQSGAITATVQDDDPQSPTFVGKIGKIVYAPAADERITSADQAKDMAVAILQRKLGPADEITVSAVPNPALQLGQTVRLTRDSIGIDRTLVVTKIDLPLTADKEMTVTLRRSIVTSDDAPLGQGMLVAQTERTAGDPYGAGTFTVTAYG